MTILTPLRRLRNAYRAAQRRRRIRQYERGARTPWSSGYIDFREEYVKQALQSSTATRWWEDDGQLPFSYGIGLDERVIEYPWALTKLSPEKALLLDAGSTLNHRSILASDYLRDKTIFIMTLAEEGMIPGANTSYIYGDLRRTVFRDDLFDEIVCISTLEHIGMDNTILYTHEGRYRENSPKDYLKAVAEFHRILKVGGQLLITVPFGRYQDLGWLQQFDYDMILELVSAFQPSQLEMQFFRYSALGWQRADSKECADCTYFDTRAAAEAPITGLAAAEAVACLRLSK